MSRKMFDSCDYICKWVSDHRGAEPSEVMEDYPKMMVKVLRHELGFTKDAAKRFVWYACEGNWLKLHETDVERVMSSYGYARILLGDLHYISDRLSFDRILRVQWLYQRLVRKCRIDKELTRPIPDETETLECVCDGVGHYGKKVTIHVMECPECGRTYEHVNGDYERCPHCGTRFGTGEDEQ